MKPVNSDTEIIKGASYETVFTYAANPIRGITLKTYTLTKGDFSNITTADAKIRLSGQTINPKNRQYWLNWTVLELDQNIYRSDWEVGEVNSHFFNLVSGKNPGAGFALLKTSLLTEGARRGDVGETLSELPEKVLDEAASAVEKALKSITSGFSGLTTPIFIVLGVLAVGLAYGLSRSRVKV